MSVYIDCFIMAHASDVKGGGSYLRLYSLLLDP